MNRPRHLRPRARRLKSWLAMLCLAAGLLTADAQDRTYVVKRNDTLYGLARANSVTVAELADRNGIARNAQLYIGQRLIIPGKAATAPPPSAVALPTPVQKALTDARVARGRWKHIVIHHTGVQEGSFKSIDRYHREDRRMENGLAYHFLIGNGSGMGDGEIAVSRRWREQLDGGHLRSAAQNKVALGICLVGNFDASPPTPQQLRALENLIRALMKRCDLPASAVRTHQQINVVHTRCPGSKFPTQSFLARLKKPA